MAKGSLIPYLNSPAMALFSVRFRDANNKASLFSVHSGVWLAQSVRNNDSQSWPIGYDSPKTDTEGKS